MRLLEACCGVLALACGGSGASGSGSLSVLVEPEDVILEGLAPGDGPEDVADGWSVDFEAYVVAVGDVEVRFATSPDDRRRAPEVFVVDLAALPPSGLELWEIEGLAAGRWDFRYATPLAAGAGRRGSTDVADYDALLAADATYLVRGTLERADGVSCPPTSLATVPASAAPAGSTPAGDACFESPRVTFEIVAAAPTRFGPCEIDGVAGVAVAPDATVTASLSIHGDHLFFNGFPEGDEGGIVRLAQWLADCDLDLDGAVTRSELEAIPLSALSEIDDRFQLGGSPFTPLETVWDYVVAQLTTQGHFQGEGECPVAGL